MTFWDFVSHAYRLRTTESLAIEHFVHQLHNTTQFLFAKLPTIKCLVLLDACMIDAVVEII